MSIFIYHMLDLEFNNIVKIRFDFRTRVYIRMNVLNWKLGTFYLIILGMIGWYHWEERDKRSVYMCLNRLNELCTACRTLEIKLAAGELRFHFPAF